MNQNRIRDKILDILSKRITHHAICWVILISGVIFVAYDEGNSFLNSIRLSAYVSGLALILIYFHFFVFERFFYRKQYYTYLILFLILTVSGSIVFKTLFFHLFNYTGSFLNAYGNTFGIIFISTSLKLIKKWFKQRMELEEITAKQLKTELDLLKAQINPHFFFNTMNCLYSLSLKKSDDVPEVILQITDLMRYSLEKAENTEVELAEECNFIKSYISLEKLRLQNCEIKFKVIGDLNGKTVAPMLLVTFVENGFKHGTKSIKNKSFVHIDLNTEGEKLIFSVENSKHKNLKNPESNSSKTGLKNVRRRLELLYPGRHKLEISETDRSYKVLLELEL